MSYRLFSSFFRGKKRSDDFLSLTFFRFFSLFECFTKCKINPSHTLTGVTINLQVEPIIPMKCSVLLYTQRRASLWYSIVHFMKYLRVLGRMDMTSSLDHSHSGMISSSISERRYRDLQRYIRKIFGIFSIFTIIISCFSLTASSLGRASYRVHPHNGYFDEIQSTHFSGVFLFCYRKCHNYE